MVRAVSLALAMLALGSAARAEAPFGAPPRAGVGRVNRATPRAVAIGTITTSALFGALCLGAATDLALRARNEAVVDNAMQPFPPDLRDRAEAAEASRVASITLFAIGGSALAASLIVGIVARRVIATPRPPVWRF